jgi:hypothetical protein
MLSKIKEDETRSLGLLGLLEVLGQEKEEEG